MQCIHLKQGCIWIKLSLLQLHYNCHFFSLHSCVLFSAITWKSLITHQSCLAMLGFKNCCIVTLSAFIQNLESTKRFFLLWLESWSQCTRYVTLEEQLSIFFYMSVTGLSIHHIGEQFQCANGTISKWVFQLLIMTI